MITEREVYEWGMKCYLHGDSQSSNPYKKRGGGPGEWDFDAWVKGWRQARDIKFVIDQMSKN